MKTAPAIRRLHTVFLAGLTAFLFCAGPQLSFAREKRAAPNEQTQRENADAQAHEAEVWKRIEPEIRAWAEKGKPYIPQAAKPDDLPQAAVPAFPGAEGAGRFSFGGRGGKIYVVTSLEDSGPGTFREACEAAGPRIIVFNVAGVIRLKSPVHVRAPYLTIAGQTAPGNGVCVAGGTVSLDTHDVVVRYMRFRRGLNDEQHREHSLTGHAVGNIIVDHCSTSWSMEENLSIYRHMYTPPTGGKDLKLPTVNITIQWTISSEGLDVNDHAFGGTWGGRNSSFHHNLFACNTGRNPSIGMSYDFNFINNVLFNWRHRTVDGGDDGSVINIINNYYKPGPVTPNAESRHRIITAPNHWSKADPVTRYGKLYAAGNFIEGEDRVNADNWDTGVQFHDERETPTQLKQVTAEGAKAIIAKVRSEKPFPMAPVNIQSAHEAYQTVIANAGANLPAQDAVDVRIIESVRTGKVSHPEGKGIITDIAQVGGFPEYQGEPVKDLCADGIPLWWKNKYKLDAKDADLASRDLQGDGYTVVEKYLNGLDPTQRIDWAKPSSNTNQLTLAQLRQ